MDRQKKEWVQAPTRPPVPPVGTEGKAHRPSSSSVGDGRDDSVDHRDPTTDASTKVMIVDFRSGEAVVRHPALVDLLNDGWSVQSAVPHIADADEVQLLVVMNRSGGTGQLPAYE